MNETRHTSELPRELFTSDELPSLPAAAVEVLRLCRDDDTTLDDLADVLSYDAALSARLLRFANSSLYDLGTEVSTIQRAALVLGLKTVQIMSLSFSLAGSLPRAGQGGGFDYLCFWKRSIVRAVAGRSFAGLVASLTEDEVFLAGLLAEIGQLVLARCWSGPYAGVLARARGWPTAELEREMLGFDHTQVGEELLRRWELPEVICATIGAAGDPDSLGAVTAPNLVRSARILAVAAAATDLLTGEPSRSALRRVEDGAERWFGLPREGVHAFLGSLEDGVRETSEMLAVPLPAGRSFEEILAEARGELLQRSVRDASQLERIRGASEIEHRRRILEDERLLDPRTGIPGRDAFRTFLQHEIDARLRGIVDRPLGLLLLQVDPLQGAGRVEESTLRAVATTVAGCVRRLDLAASLGGERFAVVMSEGSPFGLRALAERLRKAVESAAYETRGGLVTLTSGGACLGSAVGSGDAAALFEVARRYLERARQRGTNRCLVRGSLLRPAA